MNNECYPILMYHGIHDDKNAPGAFDPVYSVTIKEFREQLELLASNGYSTTLLNNINKPEKDKKIIVISFDDGDLSNYIIAFPILKEFGMYAEFFVTSDRLGRSDSVTKLHVKEMAEAGMSIQSHGQTHRFLSDISKEDLVSELETSKKQLESVTGIPVKIIALPGGRANNSVLKEAATAGYKVVCTSRIGMNSNKNLKFTLNRMAVLRGMLLSNFFQLVKGEGGYYESQLRKQMILAFAKKLLGNKLYEKIRGKILGQHS